MGITKEQKVVKQLKNTPSQKFTAIATDMFIPNHSGDHSKGKAYSTPTNDYDLANKKYVDTAIANITKFVPYTGATANVDIGTWKLTATGLTSFGDILTSENIKAGTTKLIYWNNSTKLKATSDGVMTIYKYDGTTLGEIDGKSFNFDATGNTVRSRIYYDYSGFPAMLMQTYTGGTWKDVFRVQDGTGSASGYMKFYDQPSGLSLAMGYDGYTFEGLMDGGSNAIIVGIDASNGYTFANAQYWNGGAMFYGSGVTTDDGTGYSHQFHGSISTDGNACISQTIPLAPDTTIGQTTAGSMTFVNGLLTAYTAAS